MLGPMTVGAAAFEAPDSTEDLWKLMKKSLVKSKPSKSKKLFVADSKVVYKGGEGADSLERAVLAFALNSGKQITSFAAYLDAVCGEPEMLREVQGFCDYPLPLWTNGEAVHAGSELLAQETDVKFHGLYVQVVPTPEFNRLVGRHRNKSVVIFQQNMILAERIMRQYPGDIHFTADKHGGRHYYAELLANNFFGSNVYTLSESPKRSAYEVRMHGRSLFFTFMEKADLTDMPSALASMACKYTREVFMKCFNDHWIARVPGLEPTAGYRSDCHRFIAAIRPLFGPDDEQLIIRCC